MNSAESRSETQEKQNRLKDFFAKHKYLVAGMVLGILGLGYLEWELIKQSGRTSKMHYTELRRDVKRKLDNGRIAITSKLPKTLGIVDSG